MAWTNLPWHVLGTRVAGDIGGITTYTNSKRQKVAYEKAPPKEKASPAQAHRRSLFRTALAAWKTLTPDEKAALERAASAASLCMTGQNLFVSCAMRHTNEVYDTIATQTNETLPPLPTL